jgi:hypothetical protein
MRKLTSDMRYVNRRGGYKSPNTFGLLWYSRLWGGLIESFMAYCEVIRR